MKEGIRDISANQLNRRASCRHVPVTPMRGN
jgi:hypothetical protein